MKESYRKGAANRPDPESCVTHRKVRREALTGAHAGWVLSFEKAVWERRRCQAEAPIKGAGQAEGPIKGAGQAESPIKGAGQGKRKAKRTGSQSRDLGRLPGVADPTHAEPDDAREPGGPGAARGPEKAAGRRGNPQGHAPHARRREVGLPR